MRPLADRDLELVESALRYYTVRGGTRLRGLARLENRRERARSLADEITELGLTVDEDGTGRTVVRDPLGLTRGVRT